jgi:hypothetical protein
MDTATEQEEHDASRRSLMKKAVVAGAVVWTAPVVMSAPAAFAAGSAPPTTPQETVPPESSNLAPRGAASMSSNPADLVPPPSWASNNAANLGIDGNTDGNWAFGPGQTTLPSNSIFHTDSGPGEWWQDDLGSSFTITKIVLYNRTDGGYQTRAQNIHLVVDGNDLGVIPGTTGSWNTVTLTGAPLPVSGQVVRLVNSNDDYFHLAEVEIWGH